MSKLLKYDDLKEGMFIKARVCGYSLGPERVIGGCYARPDNVLLIERFYEDQHHKYVVCKRFTGELLNREECNFRLNKTNKGHFELYIAESVTKAVGEKAQARSEKELLEAYQAGRIKLKRYGLSMTGTDPELFALDESGKVVPAFEWLPSVDSRERDSTGAPIGPFWDGFQAEFNPLPATCHQSLAYSIRAELVQLKRALNKFNPKAQLSAQSVVDVGKEELKLLPEQFVNLGCMPSLNAYGEAPLSVDPRELDYRTAGCHIHFGVPTVKERAAEIVKKLDAIAGVAMTSIFAGMEDTRRRKLYGRAGEYRLPAHGIEWRVPPAEVLANPVLFMLCFDIARGVFTHSAFGWLDEWIASDDEVREIINDSNYEDARKVLKRNQKFFAHILSNVYHEQSFSNANSLIFEGAKNLLEVINVEKNWNLHLAPEEGFSLASKQVYDAELQRKPVVKGASARE